MEHPSTWLVAERINEARQRAEEANLARAARRNRHRRASHSLLRRIRGGR